MSTAETWLGFRIDGRTKPKDAGPVGSWAMSGASGWQAQSQTSARANGVVAGSSPGHSGFKACMLVNLTPKGLPAGKPAALNLQLDPRWWRWRKSYGPDPALPVI